MIEATFSQAMAGAGIISCDAIIADGQLHRFHVEGDKSGSKNGWYILHIDGVAFGIFGSWKTGVRKTWCSKKKGDLTAAEREEQKRRIAAAIKLRETEDAAVKQAVREEATTIWAVSPSASDQHLYLRAKGVKCHGLRLYNKRKLIVPLYDSAGVLHSLQFIDFKGNKRFLPGGRKKGCHFMIGGLSGTLCIAEGYATAASIYEATGYATAVSFDAGNLLPVAQALREKFPSIKMVICADNDVGTAGNPGLTNARAAAAAVGAFITFPEWTP